MAVFETKENVWTQTSADKGLRSVNHVEQPDDTLAVRLSVLKAVYDRIPSFRRSDLVYTELAAGGMGFSAGYHWGSFKGLADREAVHHLDQGARALSRAARAVSQPIPDALSGTEEANVLVREMVAFSRLVLPYALEGGAIGAGYGLAIGLAGYSIYASTNYYAHRPLKEQLQIFQDTNATIR